MKRTVSIPVDLPSERFLPLMNQCAEIFNAHVDWAFANSTYNKNKAHDDYILSSTQGTEEQVLAIHQMWL